MRFVSFKKCSQRPNTRNSKTFEGKKEKKEKKNKQVKCLGCPTLILQKKEGSEEGNAISSRFILKTDALLNVNIKTL